MIHYSGWAAARSRRCTVSMLPKCYGTELNCILSQRFLMTTTTDSTKWTRTARYPNDAASTVPSRLAKAQVTRAPFSVGFDFVPHRRIAGSGLFLFPGAGPGPAARFLSRRLDRPDDRPRQEIAAAGRRAREAVRAAALRQRRPPACLSFSPAKRGRFDRTRKAQPCCASGAGGPSRPAHAG